MTMKIRFHSSSSWLPPLSRLAAVLLMLLPHILSFSIPIKQNHRRTTSSGSKTRNGHQQLSLSNKPEQKSKQKSKQKKKQKIKKDGDTESRWANNAMLLSSFEGLSQNIHDTNENENLPLTTAQNFLKRNLLRELTMNKLIANPPKLPLRDSLKEFLNNSSMTNAAVTSAGSRRAAEDPAEQSAEEISNDAIRQLLVNEASRLQKEADEKIAWNAKLADDAGDTIPKPQPPRNFLELRMIYIPTANYAPDDSSEYSRKEQRQRAVAQGLANRELIVKLLERLLPGIPILAVTLDFDDGSTRYPIGSDVDRHFPMEGKNALKSWNPHLVYVDDGNPFWLSHMMNLGDWGHSLRSACSTPRGKGAVYVGVGAGATIAGRLLETATWLDAMGESKSRNDPSVVQGMEQIHKWKEIRGIGFCGPSASVLPHHDLSLPEWKTMLAEKRQQQPAQDGNNKNEIIALKEWEACLTNGNSKQFVVVGDNDGDCGDLAVAGLNEPQ